MDMLLASTDGSAFTILTNPTPLVPRWLKTESGRKFVLVEIDEEHAYFEEVPAHHGEV
jgi:hypothetical protein